MSNTLGQALRVTTFGESHGKAVGAVVDGLPAGLEIDEEFIQRELDRRKPGQSHVTTQRKEGDEVEVLSGVFEGKTLGTPLCLLIRNKDAKSEDYEKLKDVFRPGHADFAWEKKFGFRDHRGGGRSSGRETAARVAAAAIAKQLLKKKGVEIVGFSREIAGVRAEKTDFSVIEKNVVRAPDLDAAKRMEEKVLEAKAAGDSVGGIVEVVVRNCPAGLGEPVFGKVEAELANALMSIPAVKGFEIGSGFAAARMRGSQHNDLMENRDGKVVFTSNNAGGVQGGITNGEEIVVRIAVKPPSSIAALQKTVDKSGREVEVSVKGRHDPCICPRVVPVAEAMVALVLADLMLQGRERE